MAKVKRITAGIILIFFISCQSGPTPVNIYPLPELELNENMSEKEIEKAKYLWALELVKYIKNFIIEIENKVPNNDLRKIDK